MTSQAAAMYRPKDIESCSTDATSIEKKEPNGLTVPHLLAIGIATDLSQLGEALGNRLAGAHSFAAGATHSFASASIREVAVFGSPSKSASIATSVIPRSR